MGDDDLNKNYKSTFAIFNEIQDNFFYFLILHKSFVWVKFGYTTNLNVLVSRVKAWSLEKEKRRNGKCVIAMAPFVLPHRFVSISLSVLYC